MEKQIKKYNGIATHQQAVQASKQDVIVDAKYYVLKEKKYSVPWSVFLRSDEFIFVLIGFVTGVAITVVGLWQFIIR